MRASFARVHRQLMGGRDAVAAFSGNPTSSSKTQYDANGDGIFESEVVTPAVSAAVDSQRFDPDFHQPFVDEFTTGYQRQLPLDMSLDLAWTHKVFRDSYAQTEINGFWPDTPGQPFGGFGMVDPRSGQIFRLTNRTWARQQFNEVMVTLAKNMSHNFQAMMSLQHQWQHEDGDWNPTDPARFIQPDAFANDKTIWRNQDPVDNNSLATGNTLRNTPTWTPGSFRVAGTWNAPKGIVLSTSYTMVGGPWTGPILAQLAANDPDVLKYGPARFNGTTPVASGGQANPLATRIRFLYPTRGEGQAGLPYVHTVNLKPAYRMKLANTRQLQVGVQHLQRAELRPLHRMAPVRSEPVIRPELLPGPGQPADVPVGAIRRDVQVLDHTAGPVSGPAALNAWTPAEGAHMNRHLYPTSSSSDHGDGSGRQPAAGRLGNQRPPGPGRGGGGRPL